MSTDTMASTAPASPKSVLSEDYGELLVAKAVADTRLAVADAKRKREDEKAAAAAAQAEEDKRSRASEAFVKAHFDWRRAVAAIHDPEAPDEEMEERFAAETEAERRLFITAAACPEQVWQKLEAFEDVLHDEMVGGPRNNSVLLLALGSIKQDMLNLELI
jgi:hypothetical protein